jgi:plasmid stabilization system protein ParE
VSFQVRYTRAARQDLRRLYAYLLDRCETREDLELAEQAVQAVEAGIEALSRSPFIYRKAGASAFLRELLIPFGRSGYVALFEIDDASTVTVLAVRHQLEDDYH